jgi:hypothetical protein
LLKQEAMVYCHAVLGPEEQTSDRGHYRSYACFCPAPAILGHPEEMGAAAIPDGPITPGIVVK